MSFTIKGIKEDIWNAKRYDLMLHLVKAKFKHNPELVAHLRATGRRTIAETGKHSFYANGLAITNKHVLDVKQ